MWQPAINEPKCMKCVSRKKYEVHADMLDVCANMINSPQMQDDAHL
jgi:hypothetical protein